MNKYYETLGLNNTATKEEVKAAYKKLAKVHHPDKGGEEAKFKEISEAYEVLSGKKQPKQQHRPQGNPFGGGNPFHGTAFEDMFRTRRKGKNIVIHLELTLEEVFSGTKKEFAYNKTKVCGDCGGHGGKEPINCNQCGGQGFIIQGGGIMYMCNNCGGKGSLFSQVCGSCGGRGSNLGEQRLNVTIPRGLRDGENLILGGVGNEIKDGAPSDVICVVNVKEHEEFKVDGLNLNKTLNIPFIDMVLGKESEFETLDGRVKIVIPKNCQTDKIFRLKNKGIYDRTGIRGDLLVTIKPKLPKEVNEEEIKHLQELKTHPNFN